MGHVWQCIQNKYAVVALLWYVNNHPCKRREVRKRELDAAQVRCGVSDSARDHGIAIALLTWGSPGAHYVMTSILLAPFLCQSAFGGAHVALEASLARSPERSSPSVLVRQPPTRIPAEELLSPAVIPAQAHFFPMRYQSPWRLQTWPLNYSDLGFHNYIIHFHRQL